MGWSEPEGLGIQSKEFDINPKERHSNQTSVGVKLSFDISVEGLDKSLGLLPSDRGSSKALGLSIGELSDCVELSSELPAELSSRFLLPFSFNCCEERTVELSLLENTQCDDADLGTLAGHSMSCKEKN